MSYFLSLMNRILSRKSSSETITDSLRKRSGEGLFRDSSIYMLVLMETVSAGMIVKLLL